MKADGSMQGPQTAAEAGPFAEALARHGLSLRRSESTTLQVNVGLLCNQACRHCHLGAGPGRTEVMSPKTMDEVVAFARRGAFSAVDITGGAPELVPGIENFLERLAATTPRLLFRSNLTALAERGDLIERLAGARAGIVASFPSLNAGQTDTQRGSGSFAAAVATLRKLNAAGYGREGSGLELDLVSTPVGAFLPPSQAATEVRFRGEAARRWGVAFNRLFTFANVPIGRFREWLTASGNLEGYLRQLAQAFNPCTIEGLMCRNLVSVSWEGVLYDCDFNLALGLPAGGARRHVSSLEAAPGPGEEIATGEHCFACTAGSGFT